MLKLLLILTYQPNYWKLMDLLSHPADEYLKTKPHQKQRKRQPLIIMKNFHEFVKEKRAEKEITLREFCREAELDPSNWSKLERGLSDPPKSKEILERISEALKLNKEERTTLFDLAMIESIPHDLRPDENILEKLPLFFRTVRGTKPSEKELRELIKALTKS